MRNWVQAFHFTAPSREIAEDQSFVGIVPAGLRTAEQLLVALQRALLLPSYFGHSWNALSDCLRDLHWMSQKRLVVWHNDLPLVGTTDCETYLDVLAGAVGSWKTGEEHSVSVVFPEAHRQDILLMAVASQRIPCDRL